MEVSKWVHLLENRPVAQNSLIEKSKAGLATRLHTYRFDYYI